MIDVYNSQLPLCVSDRYSSVQNIMIHGTGIVLNGDAYGTRSTSTDSRSLNLKFRPCKAKGLLLRG